MTEHDIEGPPEFGPEPNTHPDTPSSMHPIVPGVRKCPVYDLDAILDQGVQSIYIFKRSDKICVVIRFESSPSEFAEAMADTAALALQQVAAKPRP